MKLNLAKQIFKTQLLHKKLDPKKIIGMKSFCDQINKDNSRKDEIVDLKEQEKNIKIFKDKFSKLSDKDKKEFIKIIEKETDETSEKIAHTALVGGGLIISAVLLQAIIFLPISAISLLLEILSE